ncbi:MAG: peptidylprolyl isomerase [Planctomycetota bacterium]
MQRLHALALLAPLTLGFGCSGSAESPEGSGGGADVAAEDPLAAMQARMAETSARSDQPVDVIEVEHILVSFAGAPRMDPTKVTRTRDEAETLAAELYVKVAGGGDFTAIKNDSSDDDASTGIYQMSQKMSVPAQFQRSGMVPAFGNVGWKLEVGEISVAPYDPTDSPYGWHIIKRLK